MFHFHVPIVNVFDMDQWWIAVNKVDVHIHEQLFGKQGFVFNYAIYMELK